VRFSFNVALEKDEKGRCSHQEQRPRPEILFGSFLTPAHRLRIRFSTKPPWIISYPVGRPPLSRQPFLMLGPNKTIPMQYSKLICRQIGDSSGHFMLSAWMLGNNRWQSRQGPVGLGTASQRLRKTASQNETQTSKRILTGFSVG